MLALHQIGYDGDPAERRDLAGEQVDHPKTGHRRSGRSRRVRSQHDICGTRFAQSRNERWVTPKRRQRVAIKPRIGYNVAHIRRPILTDEEKIAEFIRTRGVDRRKPSERALGNMRERDWQAIAQGEAGIVRGNPTKPDQKPAKPGQRRVRRARIGGR